ncbi:trna intron catalytic carboxy-terminal domain protein [Cystoisospora suis]|uniref:tRNA-intron lyase n=1 Tax=Cystoisospora suis TaxID=483139 RepID=A0A2C6LAE5_9APIC|nr:trna intron catalytic carboxy-terminal domain protein [Cystoisospora suis]
MKKSTERSPVEITGRQARRSSGQKQPVGACLRHAGACQTHCLPDDEAHCKCNPVHNRMRIRGENERSRVCSAVSAKGISEGQEVFSKNSLFLGTGSSPRSPTCSPLHSDVSGTCPSPCAASTLDPSPECSSPPHPLFYMAENESISISSRQMIVARAIVSTDLRARGFFVRDGLTYGSDWLLYPLRPSDCHAVALVFVFVFPCSCNRAPSQADRGQEAVFQFADCMRCGAGQSARRVQEKTRTRGSAATGAGGAGAESYLPTDSAGGHSGSAEGLSGGIVCAALPVAALVRMERLAAAVGKRAILALVDSSLRRLPKYVQLSWIGEG